MSIIIALCFTHRVDATTLSHSKESSITIKSDSTQIKKKKKEKRKKGNKIADILADSMSVKSDSLTISNAKGTKKIELLIDSLRKKGVIVDSLTIDSLARHYFSDTLKVRAGVLPKINSDGNTTNARILDSLLFAERLAQNNIEKEKKRINLFRDTVPFGRVTTLAIIFPGYAQMYNKQYWKLPILYGGVGAFAATGAMMGNKGKSIKREFDAAVTAQNQPEIDRLYGKYRNYQTATTLLYVGAAVTYMYFLADGAFNYKGEEDAKNRATYLAFMFPGAGQIYNKQYWKLPIVYGGFATLGYIINFNGRGYTRYKRAYDAVTAGETDEFNGTYSEDVLRNTKNNFRRARDMAIFYTVGFYLLTVVDAYVSASFKQYDISDDLSIKVAPVIDYNQIGSNYNRNSGNGSYGLSMRLTF